MRAVLSRFRDWHFRLQTGAAKLLPCACALCGADSKAAACDTCRTQYLSRAVHRCARCAITLEDETANECGGCLASPPAFDATFVAADYAAPLDQLVLTLKFRAGLALAPLMAELLLDEALRRRGGDLPEAWCAVPLGPVRLAERGFNQALEIARPLARASGIPLEKQLLIRVRETGAQSLLHPDQRRKNVRGAFAVSPHALTIANGRHIGVVDDVMTTGETLNEVAATLKRFGAARVTNFVFARTPPK